MPSTSKSQQQAAAIALQVKKGNRPKSDLYGASKKMAQMSQKDLEKFARTKHKGLPKRKGKKKKVNEAWGQKLDLYVDIIYRWLKQKGFSASEIDDILNDPGSINTIESAEAHGINPILAAKELKIGEILTEALDFERGQDPMRAMELGIFYDKWRKDHDKKPLFTCYFYLTDPFKNKYTYWVHLYYENGSRKEDTVYFSGERLIGDWGFSGTPFSLSNMQNKPTNMFNKDETSFWSDPKVFNKIIDQLTDKKKAEKWFKEMTEEWFEDPFDTMMRSWFRSGVYRIDHSELKFKG
jgi:hypothetical protein